MGEKDPDVVGRFVERLGLLLAEGGVPRMPARVFACLMASDEGRLTASELANALRVSPAAVSGAVRYLMQVGLIAKARDPGARRDHYTVSDNSWMEAFTNRDRLLENWMDAFSEGIEVLGIDSPAGRRLDTSRRFFAFVQKEMAELIQRWREQEGIG